MTPPQKIKKKLTPRERITRDNDETIRKVMRGDMKMPGLSFGDPNEDWEDGRPRPRFLLNFAVNFILYFLAFASIFAVMKWFRT